MGKPKVVVAQPATMTHLEFFGQKKCCCCRGCCWIHFGVTLGSGLSVIWALLAIAVSLGGVDYYMFDKLFNLVYLLIWAVFCGIAFLGTLCFNYYWFVCIPYLVLTFVYVILLGVSGFISFARVLNHRAYLGDHIQYVVNIPMCAIQLWNLIYSVYLVYHMHIDRVLRAPPPLQQMGPKLEVALNPDANIKDEVKRLEEQFPK